MNRIILIGNGFDLAHGMATSYKDFIDNYWTRFTKALSSELNIDRNVNKYEDSFATFQASNNAIRILAYQWKDILKNNMSYKLFLEKLCNVYNRATHVNVNRGRETQLSFQNDFLRQISESSCLNWVDVENEYYAALLKVLRTGIERSNKESSNIDKLNSDFEDIRKLLEEYLTQLPDTTQKYDTIQKKILAPLHKKDIAHAYKMALVKHIQQRVDRIGHEIAMKKWNGTGLGDEEDIKRWTEDIRNIQERGNRRQFMRDHMDELPSYFSLPEEIMLVNFNYTDTIKRYIPEPLQSSIKLVNIHGLLNDSQNPMIFGYGDDLDSHYAAIEERNDNRYLEYIKSTSYHRTDSYRRMLEFADTGYFQIFIMGHSCGNSDRTLLNTLFEHRYCMSIKPFYYQNDAGVDNYSDIVRNISRNFKDKQLMRERVVNKMYCEPLI